MLDPHHGANDAQDGAQAASVEPQGGAAGERGEQRNGGNDAPPRPEPGLMVREVSTARVAADCAAACTWAYSSRPTVVAVVAASAPVTTSRVRVFSSTVPLGRRVVVLVPSWMRVGAFVAVAGWRFRVSF
jgi:hypothetical protein